MDTPPILDFHAHLPPGERAAQALLAEMDRCGIGRCVIVAGGVIAPEVLSRQLVEGGQVTTDADNEAVLAAAGGRLVPFYFANPHRDAGVYAAAGPSFAGLKLAPGVHGVPLDAEPTHDLIRVARELHHPVYLHCLQRPGFGVRDLVGLAGRHPDVSFVLGHAGVTHMDWYAVELIADVPNIWLETSGGYASVVSTALRLLGPDRVVFGSEYPLQRPEVELAKLRALDLPPDVWQRVVSDNALRLLGKE
ncbi:amidohydrolase family protein [Allorhizocola rhizosphaerae]|uniref:amidohydrolase family protein n=1 Tax=Allorhizocola rhizosphaerae TaxID=1872709 RepID=UPI000E3E809E|nr:amidohydrolase family protein [Allorhizocola rhizosphaerae]